MCFLQEDLCPCSDRRFASLTATRTDLVRSQGIIETRSLSNDQPREERCLSVGPSDAVKIGMAARNDQVQKKESSDQTPKCKVSWRF